ncbi:MAG: hypothetical protein MUF18_10770 [Fimbriiglobus sp.]|nr:hypothetical protein [Fimbriiglobus sp.]
MRPLFALLLFTLPAAAAPVPKALKKPLPQNPDGAWVLIEFSSDGAPLSPPVRMARDWFISGEHLDFGGKSQLGAVKRQPNFTIYDPARPHLRRWGTNLVAYELDSDGDTLRMCYAHDGRTELTECKREQGIHYYVFKRVPTDK